MSVRQFAAYLGVSDRTVSKWEAGGERVQPRPDTQAMLDTALQRAGDEVHARFLLLSEGNPDVTTPSSFVRAADPALLHANQIRHPTTGKEMVLIVEGLFRFGPDDRIVTLPAYYIDITPVTNAEYEKFVASTEHPAPTHWLDGCCPDALRAHPVVNVRHRDAQAYVRWARTHLPTEEQWEKAARGEHGQHYPWGDQPTVAKCNVRESRIGRTTPVERYHSGVSPYGVYDMSGNVWEWCATETEPDRYVLKGSAFTSPFSMAVASATNDASVDMFDDDTGFRCVISTSDRDPRI